MFPIIISGSGYFLPDDIIENDELVLAFNKYANKVNMEANMEKIKKSSSEFIYTASGIKKRHVCDKQGILDEDIMRPMIKRRSNNILSLQAEMAVKAAKHALKEANKKPNEIDVVFIACSNMQRSYPAIAIEVQDALNIEGWGVDINVACSSAIFGISMAASNIQSNLAKSVLVITPEIYTGHLNFQDRKSHFIFGDGASAIVVEAKKYCSSNNPYLIINSKLKTKYSNNIRNNFGFLNRSIRDVENNEDELLFSQNGKNVRDQIVPLVSDHILEHLNDLNMSAVDIKKIFLHQSNIHMNMAIAKNVYGRDANDFEIPHVLDKYGNIGAAGAIITFNKYNKDLLCENYCMLCAYGAGYSVGSIVLKKI